MYNSQFLRHTHFEHNKLFNNHSKIFDTKASRYEANILWLFQKRCVTFSNFVTLQDHWVTSDPKFSKCYNFSSVRSNQSKLILKYLIDQSHLYLIRNYFVIFPCHPVMQNMSKPFLTWKTTFNWWLIDMWQCTKWVKWFKFILQNEVKTIFISVIDISQQAGKFHGWPVYQW